MFFIEISIFDVRISKKLIFKFFQVEQDLSIGISAVSASGDASDGPEVPLANGEKSKKEKASKKEEAVTPKKKQADDDKKHGVTRVYSNLDASGKLYLKRIQTVAESKKQSKIIKYPLVRIRGSHIYIHLGKFVKMEQVKLFWIIFKRVVKYLEIPNLTI